MEKKSCFNRRIILFFLYISIVANLFLYQMYRDACNNDFAWELYRKVSFAAREHRADILDGYSIERPDEYWSKKFVEIRQRGNDRTSLHQQILVEYDNGETLVIEVAETYEHDYVVKDLYFLDKNETKD